EVDGKRYLRYPKGAEAVLEHIGQPLIHEIVDEDPLAKMLHLSFLVDAHPSWDPATRLADLEREGTMAAVLIHNPAYAVQRRPIDVEAQRAYCQVVNDWQADVFKNHLDRFAPGIHLPWLDPAGCAKELERAAGMGLRPGLLPDGIWDAPYWKS